MKFNTFKKNILLIVSQAFILDERKTYFNGPIHNYNTFQNWTQPTSPKKYPLTSSSDF